MKKKIMLPLVAVFALVLAQFIWAQGQDAGVTRRALRGIEDPTGGGGTPNARRALSGSKGQATLRVITQTLLGSQPGRPEVGRPGTIAANGNNYQVMFAKRRTTITYGTRKPRGSYTGPTMGNNVFFIPLPPGANSVILILDVSGSMSSYYNYSAGDTRSCYEVMKADTDKFLRSLGSNKSYMVYLFDGSNYPDPLGGTKTPHKMSKATKKNVDKTMNWMVHHGGSTDPDDSFADAFKIGAPVIYFLCDGSFYSSGLTSMINSGTHGNTIINTVAIGAGAPTTEMLWIANKTGGTMITRP
jgi:hypothetical protein